MDLCVKDCGFYGSSSTMNMCSNCYKKHLIEQKTETKTSVDDDHTNDAPLNTSSPPLCAKGCGFFGSTTTMNMCSSCYKDHISKHKKIAAEPLTATTSLSTNTTLTTDVNSKAINSNPVIVKNRCESCNKKVGLTGFKCRCEKTFCGKHRYPQEHSCSFDFKKADIEILIKQNPVIKADKLERRI
ncbi:hypothetical protein ACFE04_019046 [Oxalis oulophora]